MAHQLEKMAYTGETPWHQLGNQLPAKQPIEVWAEKAGMNWDICATPVRYMTEQAGSLGSIMSYDEQQVLYRSDTKAPLSPWSAAVIRWSSPRPSWSSTVT